MGPVGSLPLWLSLCREVNGGRLQVAPGGSQELLTVEKRLTFFTTGLGWDKSMTVSLEEMLEEEDMLSRWLLGLNLLQRRSPMVASVQTAGTGDWACPATSTPVPTFVLPTGLFEGNVLKSSSLTTVAAGTGGLDPAGSSFGSLRGCIWTSVGSSSGSGSLLPLLSFNVSVFSTRESGEDLERTRTFSASPLSLMEQSRASLVGRVDWNVAFIAVENEYSSGDREWCER